MRQEPQEKVEEGSKNGNYNVQGDSEGPLVDWPIIPVPEYTDDCHQTGKRDDPSEKVRGPWRQSYCSATARLFWAPLSLI